MKYHKQFTGKSLKQKNICRLLAVTLTASCSPSMGTFHLQLHLCPTTNHQQTFIMWPSLGITFANSDPCVSVMAFNTLTALG